MDPDEITDESTGQPARSDEERPAGWDDNDGYGWQG
jgi:hypothetical protein